MEQNSDLKGLDRIAALLGEKTETVTPSNAGEPPVNQDPPPTPPVPVDPSTQPPASVPGEMPPTESDDPGGKEFTYQTLFDSFFEKYGDRFDAYQRSRQLKDFSSKDLLRMKIQEENKSYSPELVNHELQQRLAAYDLTNEDENLATLNKKRLDADMAAYREDLKKASDSLLSEIIQQEAGSNPSAESIKAMQAERAKIISQNEVTQSLLKEKMLSFNVGGEEKFNLELEDPEILVKMAEDPGSAFDFAVDDKGNINMEAFYKGVHVMNNLDKVVPLLINYGKNLARAEVVGKMKNSTPPNLKEGNSPLTDSIKAGILSIQKRM